MELIEDFGRKHWALTAGLFILLSSVASLSYLYTQVDVVNQSETLNTNSTVFDPNNSLRAGIATGQRMSFGEFDARFNKTKTLNLSSTDPTLVEIDTKGNVSGLLKYERMHFFENKTQIDFEMTGNQSGFYEGQINLDMTIAQNTWGKKWIELKYKYFS